MRRRLLAVALALVAAGVVLGFVFAGSAAKIADGVRVDGIDVGGLDTNDALALLQQKALAVANTQLLFSEVSYQYSSLFVHSLIGDLTLSDKMYMSPRISAPTYGTTACT